MDYVRGLSAERVIVLIGEVQPARLWERTLKNRRSTIVARRLSRSTDAVVCRYRMPLSATASTEPAEAAHAEGADRQPR